MSGCYNVDMKNLVTVLTAAIIFSACSVSGSPTVEQPVTPSARSALATASPSVQPVVTLSPIPNRKVLQNDYHIFQTFNNCGPASLSMALSYYGVNVTQKELGDDLRPYQVPGGDNDDKSVTLAELAEKAKEYGVRVYHRPGGTVEIMQQLVALDLPVVTRTWLKVNDDIGHYRVVKGYDKTAGTLVQDDSLQGKNLTYSNADFDAIWRKFGYEFLVLVPDAKVAQVERVLGDLKDESRAWEKTVEFFEDELVKNPNDLDARFQLSVALYHTGEYQRSTDEFEKVEARLPMRALWYQIEPIQAYVALKEYDRVFAMTDKILNNHNRAFSELYYIRGKIYQERGQNAQAKAEFEKALAYNRNFELAKQVLNSL